MGYIEPPVVEFTQYLLPDGKKRPTHIRVSNAAWKKAGEIVALGFCFECEILQTGQVSLTIADADGDHAIKICPNGPGVRETVERLILDFNPGAVERGML